MQGEFGYTNEQRALYESLAASDILPPNEPSYLVAVDLVALTGSDAILTFVDESWWATWTENAPPCAQNFTAFLQAADRLQGFCMGKN